MIDKRQIEQMRPPKVLPDAWRPWRFLQEEEPGDGGVTTVNTVFLTGSECPFRCIMCDLWKNTLDGPTPEGAIPHQIRYALKRLPKASQIKLYNSSNFFDKRAVPEKDYLPICSLLAGYENVIVENHPRLCGEEIPRFRDLLGTSLEVALGLETIHPEVLPRLNKQITTGDFAKAVQYLNRHDIHTRVFILLNPPFLNGVGENIRWCLKSIDFAFELGVRTCSIIPTRAGNGIMERLQQQGEFTPPALETLEEVFDEALSSKKGRVLADIWDLQFFSGCRKCFRKRKDRLNRMNLLQKKLPRISCECQSGLQK